MNTKYYGVPQSRNRGITLMTLRGEKEWKHPPRSKKLHTIRETIGHLPSLKSMEQSRVHKWHRCRKHPDRHILWMSHTPTGKASHDNPVHFPKTKGRRIRGFHSNYKRCDWDKPCYTITCGSSSIGVNNSVHPGNPILDKDDKPTGLYDNARVFSVLELILLTGLTRDWDPPTANERLIRTIIGESIPPNLIRELVKTLPIQSEIII